MYSALGRRFFSKETWVAMGSHCNSCGKQFDVLDADSVFAKACEPRKTAVGKQSLLLDKAFRASQHSQSGQVAVLVLLLMVVLLTIGLSLASRVTQDIFLSQQQSDSGRVFNAAESGAEVALSQDYTTISGPQSGSGTIDGGKLAYNYTIIPRQELEQDLKEGESATVVVEREPVGSLTVEWGATGECEDASLILSTYFEEPSGIKVRHVPIAPHNCDRLDNFESSAGNGASQYKNTYDLDTMASTVLYVRIKAVYNDTTLQVTGLNLPDQQYLVRSQASNTEGTEQRTVEVTRGIPAPPSFMDYSVYTRGSIEKNQ